jgi:hypothetical protein
MTTDKHRQAPLSYRAPHLGALILLAFVVSATVLAWIDNLGRQAKSRSASSGHAELVSYETR